MSLKQKLIDLSFNRDQDGRTIAYLYGRTRYVVPDAATEARLRDLKWRLVVAQMLPGIVGMLVGLVTPGLAYGWAIALWCALLLLATLVDLCLRAAARKGPPAASPQPRLWRWPMHFREFAPPFPASGVGTCGTAWQARPSSFWARLRIWPWAPGSWGTSWPLAASSSQRACWPEAPAVFAGGLTQGPGDPHDAAEALPLAFYCAGVPHFCACALIQARKVAILARFGALRACSRQ